jgi:hypothetical protein
LRTVSRLIVAPSRCGAIPRLVVSTSGSSGMEIRCRLATIPPL